MPANRITLTLDQPFTEMVGEGWGMGKVAGALQFGTRNAAFDSPISGHHPAGVQPSSIPDGFWKVPGVGCITLKPILESRGIVNVDDPFYHGWSPSEITLAPNDDGGDGHTLLTLSGTYGRIRKSGASALVATLANIAEGAILATISGRLRLAWKTNSLLKINEGWAIFVQPVRTFVDNHTFGYMAFTFGAIFSLGIDLHGFATLYENVGTVGTPNWFVRKRMDLGGAGLNLRSDFRVMMIPIGGRYVVFRFGNVESTVFGLRPDRYDHLKQFVYDCVEEGGGNYWDASAKQHVVVPSGKLGIAVQSAGTDYRFTPYKLRYPIDQSYITLFTPEPLPNLLPEQTPKLTPYGFASGYQHGGAGVMTVSLQSDVATTWDPATDTQVVPSLSMTASADGVYTPELWYLDAYANPKTEIPPWTPYDASKEWYTIRFQRTVQGEPGVVEFKLKDDSRYASIYRRGGPVRVAIDGLPVADGYVHLRKPTVGVKVVDAEYNGHDMWERLNVPCGKFETLDGKKVATVLFRLLRRAGFPDDQISIEDDELKGILFEEFTHPQTLKLFDYGCTVDDAIRDILKRNTVQGADAIRVRWDGAKWRVYFAPSGYDWTLPAPTTVFYTHQAALPAGITKDVDRWGGETKYFLITSFLEPTQTNPEFNRLRAFTASKGEGDGLECVIDPDPAVVSDGDPTKQEFEGRLRVGEVGPPEVTATTMGGLKKEARTYYTIEQRKGLSMGFQAEWQPSVDVDQEAVILGVDLSGAVKSYGVFRIEEIDAAISTDDVRDIAAPVDPGTGLHPILVRAWEWSASYTLHWLRPTPADYAFPMFSDVVPAERTYAA